MKRTALDSTCRRTAIAMAIASSLTGPVSAAGGGIPDEPPILVTTLGFAPAVARNATGDFVVAFEGRDAAGHTRVFVRRVAASGAVIGAAFPVSPPLLPGAAARTIQSHPRVAMDDEGNFVVTWVNSNLLGATYARRFAADGSPRGGNILIADNSSAADVAMDRDGDFAVVWNTYAGAGIPIHGGYGSIRLFDTESIHARRYHSNGTRDGQDILVDRQTTLGNPSEATGARSLGPFGVALDGNGNLVVAWERENLRHVQGTNTNFINLMVSRFGADGRPQGSPSQVNGDGETSIRGNPVSVAADASGGVVIAWEALSSTFQDQRVSVRSYDASGAARGAQVRVSGPDDTAFAPQVTTAPNGRFVLTWRSFTTDPSVTRFNQDFMRIFNADMSPRSGVLSATPGYNGVYTNPAIASDATGDYVIVAGEYDNNDDRLIGMRAQRFTAP